MALQHLGTFLCDYLVTGQDARHTLINTFHNIGHQGAFPAVKLPFCFVVELQGEGEPFRVVLEGPPGDKLLLEGVAGVPDPDKRDHAFQQWTTTLTAELVPGVFPVPGVYSITVYSGETEIHRRRFGVFPAPDSKQASGAS